MMDEKEFEKLINNPNPTCIPVTIDEPIPRGINEESEEDQMTDEEIAASLMRQRVNATQQDVQHLRLRVEKTERVAEHNNKMLQAICLKLGIQIPGLR